MKNHRKNILNRKLNQIKLKRYLFLQKTSEEGYTLVEILVVVVMITFLATLGIPSWIRLVNNTQIKNSRSAVFEAIQEAKTKATQRKARWSASFQQNGDKIQWAVHAQSGTENWQTIDIEGVGIDPENTNLGGATSSPWKITFDEKGQVDEDSKTGQITLFIQNNPAIQKRCVIVKTILGAMVNKDGEDCRVDDTP